MTCAASGRAGAATPWEKTFTVSVATAQRGAAAITVIGEKIDAAANEAGAAAGMVAPAIVARISSEVWLPVKAETGEGGEFTVKSVVAGTGGNANRVTIVSEAAGVTIAEGTTTTGAQAANLAPLFPGLGSVRYNYVISDFDDPGNIAALGGELSSRFSAMRQIGGRAFMALAGGIGGPDEPGTVLAQAASVNNPHIVLVPRLTSLQLPGEWAARWCAVACRILAGDSAANTCDFTVTGLTSNVEVDADTRQVLLTAGIAAYRPDATGNVLIERLVTSCTENTDGGRDTSYLDIQVPETVDALRTYVKAEAKKRYRTWKLAGTEENFGPGAKVMTAGIFRSFLCELYQAIFIKDKRWRQDFEGYKASRIVEVKKGSKTWLEYSPQPNLIGQFSIGAGLLQFK